MFLFVALLWAVCSYPIQLTLSAEDSAAILFKINEFSKVRTEIPLTVEQRSIALEWFELNLRQFFLFRFPVASKTKFYWNPEKSSFEAEWNGNVYKANDQAMGEALWPEEVLPFKGNRKAKFKILNDGSWSVKRDGKEYLITRDMYPEEVAEGLLRENYNAEELDVIMNDIRNDLVTVVKDDNTWTLVYAADDQKKTFEISETNKRYLIIISIVAVAAVAGTAAYAIQQNQNNGFGQGNSDMAF